MARGSRCIPPLPNIDLAGIDSSLAVVKSITSVVGVFSKPPRFVLPGGPTATGLGVTPSKETSSYVTSDPTNSLVGSLAVTIVVTVLAIRTSVATSVSIKVSVQVVFSVTTSRSTSRLSFPTTFKRRVILISPSSLSKTPLAWKFAEATDKAPDKLNELISSKTNCLSPVKKRIATLLGTSNDPIKEPSASVIKLLLPLLCS